jgi:hypothetical protein
VRWEGFGSKRPLSTLGCYPSICQRTLTNVTKSLSGWTAAESRIEPETFRIRCTGACHWTTAFHDTERRSLKIIFQSSNASESCGRKTGVLTPRSQSLDGLSVVHIVPVGGQVFFCWLLGPRWPRCVITMTLYEFPRYNYGNTLPFLAYSLTVDSVDRGLRWLSVKVLGWKISLEFVVGQPENTEVVCIGVNKTV